MIIIENVCFVGCVKFSLSLINLFSVKSKRNSFNDLLFPFKIISLYKIYYSKQIMKRIKKFKIINSVS